MSDTNGIKAYGDTRTKLRERQILEHQELARRIALSIASRTPSRVDAADLISAGMMGLIRAVDLYDPSRGVPFEPFAAPYIRGAIMDHLRAQDPVPYSTRRKIRKLEKTSADLQRTLKRTPTEGELADAMQETELDVAKLMTQALSVPMFAGDELPQHFDEAVGGSPHPDALSRLESEQLRAVLVGLLQGLPKQEREVLVLYYYEELKMKDIGKVLGISESRVSQIHKRAVTLLRGQLKERLGAEE